MCRDAVRPEAFSRRSFVYRKLRECGARFDVVAGAAVAMSCGDEQAEAGRAARLALADLSPLHRTGFRGPGVATWLAAQGMVVPQESNRSVRQANGSLVARLSPAEMLVLDDLACTSATVECLRGAWQKREGTPESTRAFLLPREDSHVWFGLAGTQAAALMSKLCAVDLRPKSFAGGAVAQTSVASMNAIVIRCDLGRTLHYHLLADSAAAAYLWDCLVDAMSEFNAQPVGLAALRRLCEKTA